MEVRERARESADSDAGVRKRSVENDATARSESGMKADATASPLSPNWRAQQDQD
jgi:hypothetical protein